MTTANKKISELPELTQIHDEDLLVIVDWATMITKKITRANLVAGLGGGGVGLPTESIRLYDSVSTIVKDTLTTILTHTVDIKDLWLDNIYATGDVDAEYWLYVDNVPIIPFRTSEQDRTGKVNLPIAQKFVVGTILDIKVKHYNINTSDFTAVLIGHKY